MQADCVFYKKYKNKVIGFIFDYTDCTIFFFNDDNDLVEENSQLITETQDYNLYRGYDSVEDLSYLAELKIHAYIEAPEMDEDEQDYHVEYDDEDNEVEVWNTTLNEDDEDSKSPYKRDFYDVGFDNEVLELGSYTWFFIKNDYTVHLDDFEKFLTCALESHNMDIELKAEKESDNLYLDVKLGYIELIKSLTQSIIVVNTASSTNGFIKNKHCYLVDNTVDTKYYHKKFTQTTFYEQYYGVLCNNLSDLFTHSFEELDKAEFYFRYDTEPITNFLRKFVFPKIDKIQLYFAKSYEKLENVINLELNKETAQVFSLKINDTWAKERIKKIGIPVDICGKEEEIIKEYAKQLLIKKVSVRVEIVLNLYIDTKFNVLDFDFSRERI